MLASGSRDKTLKVWRLTSDHPSDVMASSTTAAGFDGDTDADHQSFDGGGSTQFISGTGTGHNSGVASLMSTSPDRVSSSHDDAASDDHHHHRVTFTTLGGSGSSVGVNDTHSTDDGVHTGVSRGLSHSSSVGNLMGGPQPP
jgi:hypothetical protein